MSMLDSASDARRLRFGKRSLLHDANPAPLPSTRDNHPSAALRPGLGPQPAGPLCRRPSAIDPRASARARFSRIRWSSADPGAFRELGRLVSKFSTPGITSRIRERPCSSAASDAQTSGSSSGPSTCKVRTRCTKSTPVPSLGGAVHLQLLEPRRLSRAALSRSLPAFLLGCGLSPSFASSSFASSSSFVLFVLLVPSLLSSLLLLRVGGDRTGPRRAPFCRFRRRAASVTAAQRASSAYALLVDGPVSFEAAHLALALIRKAWLTNVHVAHTHWPCPGASPPEAPVGLVLAERLRVQRHSGVRLARVLVLSSAHPRREGVKLGGSLARLPAVVAASRPRCFRTATVSPARQ